MSATPSSTVGASKLPTCPRVAIASVTPVWRLSRPSRADFTLVNEMETGTVFEDGIMGNPLLL